MDNPNQDQTQEKVINLSSEAAQFLEKQMKAEQMKAEQQELVNKGLNGELGIEGGVFKELYEKGNLKEKIEKWGFSKSNAQLLVESSIEAYQISVQQKAKENAQSGAAGVGNAPQENVTAKLAQQAASGGQIGHNAKKADDKNMNEPVVFGKVDYDRLDKVSPETKFTHSVLSSWGQR